MCHSSSMKPFQKDDRAHGRHTFMEHRDFNRWSPLEGLYLLRSYCAIGKMLLETINGSVKKRK